MTPPPLKRLVGLLVLALGAVSILVAFPMSAAQADPPAANMWIVASPNPILANDYSTLSVTVDNGIVGETVAFDHKVGGLLWSQIATRTLDADLRAELSQHPTLAGSYQYRARVVSNANHAATTSAVLTLSVVNTLPPPPDTFTCGGEDPGVPVAKPGGGDWECSFNDEFDGDELNEDYWSTPELGYMPSPTTDRACYGAEGDVGNDNSTANDNVWVADDHLHLQATIRSAAALCPGSQTKTSRKWGAQVWTNKENGSLPKFSQTYGYFEVKATLPARWGEDEGVGGTTLPLDEIEIDGQPGLQSTFYLWPSSNRYGSWPSSGEMDFAEFYSAFGNINFPTNHWGTSILTHQSYTGEGGADCNINPGEANVYKFLWYQGHMTGWINDNEDPCIDQAKGTPFDNSFYLILNNAFGTDMPAIDYDNSYTPGPTENGPVGDVSIDYVRVWK